MSNHPLQQNEADLVSALTRHFAGALLDGLVDLVQEHVVDSLGGIHLLLAWLSLLLIGLALLAIAVFIESRGSYPAAG